MLMLKEDGNSPLKLQISKGPTAQQPLILTNRLRPRSSPLSQFPTLDSVSRSSQPGPPEGETPLSKREALYPNGTLLIRNVAQKDTGSYTLLVTKNDLQTERQIGHLHVYPVLPTPVITSNNSNPREHEDTVVLTCGSETQNTSYMWWINSQSLPKSMRLELSKDKRTLTLVTVTRNDTGPYVCEARNPVSVSRSDPFTLDVLWQENSRALGVGAITGIVIAVLLVLTPLAGLGCFIFLHSGRETLYPNGTRLIQNVTQKDTGSYTLLVTKKDLQTERQAGHLHVHPVLPTPVITSNNSNPREHEDTVVLTCGSETQNTSYMWWINNQSLPKSMRLKLSKDKRTLILVAVTRNDTGPYVCEARNPVSVSRSDPFTLDVLSSNATVTEHEGPVVLTCLADETGVSICWFFKGQSLLLAERMTLSSDNSTLTIDPVSREDAGDYQCEAFNRGNSSRSDPLRLRVTCE
ncbi:hypothetical protein AB1E18_013472 [Capra hircus]